MGHEQKNIKNTYFSTWKNIVRGRHPGVTTGLKFSTAEELNDSFRDLVAVCHKF